MSNLRLFWEKDRGDRFPHDTNLYVSFGPSSGSRLVGWVRQIMTPAQAGFYAHPSATLNPEFPPGIIDPVRAYPTRAHAMRALRNAAIVTWIATSPERREYFINVKGRI